MSGALNNVTAPDTYTAASTLSCAATARVRLQINNQAIYWKRGHQNAGGGGVFYEPEEFILPGLYSLEELCDVVAIRAATPLAQIPAGGTQAQVTLTTRTASELPS